MTASISLTPPPVWAGSWVRTKVRDELAAAASEAREQAEQLARLVEQLELADAARTVFLTESAVTRDEAERARVVAGLHGVNLDDHSDRVTAQEWLDAHLLAQLADEAAREITEDDVLEDTHAADRSGDSHAVRDDPARLEADAIAPDIREMSLPDPTERADPAVRRRVPPLDAAAATLDRANVLLREVAERRRAEQAAAAYAAEQEPDEDQLRAELARQATYDRDAADVDDDGEVLDRAM